MTDLRVTALTFDLKRLDAAFLDDPFPVYRALREHDPGVQRLQRIVGEAERVKRSGLEIGEHCVGFGDEPTKDVGALGVPQVQTEAVLVAVRQRPRPAHRLPRLGLA